MDVNNIKKICFTLLVLTLIGFAADFHSVSAEDSAEENRTVLFFSDFERKDDFSKWKRFGGDVTIEEDSSRSHSGQYSLKASGRQFSYSSPSLDITDLTEPGKTYSVSMWFSYNGRKTDNIHLSMKATYSKRDDEYKTIVSIPNPEANTWISLESSFTIPDDAAETVLYFDSEGPENTLWIDDITISADKSEEITYLLRPHGTTMFTFENMYLDIVPEGNAMAVRSSDISLNDEYSLLVTRRTDCRDGVSLNLNRLEQEKIYRCSTAVTFLDKTVQSESFSMYLSYYNNGILYNIPVEGNHPVELGTWTVLKGTFTIPAGASEAFLIISTVRPEDEHNYTHISFYVDDLTISDDPMTTEEKITYRKKILALSISLAGLAAAVSVSVILIRKGRESKKKIMSASIDSMTGALNRNAYEEKIGFYEKHPVKCKKLYIAVCDLDGLKNINDTYGHKAGDECITRCAHMLIRVLSEVKGNVYRTGGDEFICISEKPFRTSLEKSINAEEKTDSPYKFSASAGFTEYDKSSDGTKPDIKLMISRCDREMYKNKISKKS